ncbi:hypothetical protein [Gluconacetobacter diazotrophicus]|uniref:hypothetical protein n=1 Tax=Gluconacetobacter diazotrophicus TaxID=33996 RepID=UPI00059ED602|nr:hypothetical protein [Gluconacetobacter diazotrophicus]
MIKFEERGIVSAPNKDYFSSSSSTNTFGDIRWRDEVVILTDEHKPTIRLTMGKIDEFARNRRIDHLLLNLIFVVDVFAHSIRDMTS